MSRRTLDPGERRDRNRRAPERDDELGARRTSAARDDVPRRPPPVTSHEERRRRHADTGTSPTARRPRVLALVCLGLLILAVVPTGLSSVGPPDKHVEKHDPRYATQTGSLEGTRRQTILNDNEDALDHALETCGAAGVHGLAAKFDMAPDIPRLAARYARDFEVSARRSRRAGCAIGLREGG